MPPLGGVSPQTNLDAGGVNGVGPHCAATF